MKSLDWTVILKRLIIASGTLKSAVHFEIFNLQSIDGDSHSFQPVSTLNFHFPNNIHLTNQISIDVVGHVDSVIKIVFFFFKLQKTLSGNWFENRLLPFHLSPLWSRIQGDCWYYALENHKTLWHDVFVWDTGAFCVVNVDAMEK